jgi:hypothetical protein
MPQLTSTATAAFAGRKESDYRQSWLELCSSMDCESTAINQYETLGRSSSGSSEFDEARIALSWPASIAAVACCAVRALANRRARRTDPDNVRDPTL